MINRPRNWNKLLKAAPQGSVLMGGAIRDWLVDREAKDFDIFHTYEFGVPQIDGWVYKENPDLEAHQAEYDIGDPNGPIGSVYDYEVLIVDDFWGPRSVKVQLIGVIYDDPTKHFGSFDHTLTLGLYSKHGLYVDQRMFDSFNTKSVTCTNNSKPEKSLLRAKKAVAKISLEGAEDWNYLGF